MRRKVDSWGVMMTGVRDRGQQIRSFILERIQESRHDVTSATAKHFDITRQAVNKHLQRLVDEGVLESSGSTRGKAYRLSAKEWEQWYDIESGMEEDVIWTREVKAVLGDLPPNVLDIWYFGFTEMFNNAVDHSEGSQIGVHICKTAVTTEMLIADDGCGIFKKIQNALGLLDERHSVLELSKGKLTTDPEHHTGEGIFFSSRMFDRFNILSGGVYFAHKFGDAEDWILERNQADSTTSVLMSLDNRTNRTPKQVFDEFSSDEDYGFTRTVVPVRMAQYGEDKLISRSQAKRVLARVEQFRTVLFDFNEVETIGPAFADEIFRVFALQHPDIELAPISTNPEIKRMIGRVLRENVRHMEANKLPR